MIAGSCGCSGNGPVDSPPHQTDTNWFVGRKNAGEGVRFRVHLGWTVSGIAHAILLAAIILQAPRLLPVHEQVVEAIDVAVLQAAPPPSSPPVSSSAPPQAEAPPQPAPLPRTPAAPRPETSRQSGMVTPKAFYAGAVLSDPRNRKTRAEIAGLMSDERLIQVCNIEAMEQLKRWRPGFAADHVVPYAEAEPVLTATTLDAKGAAVHAGDAWYQLRFTCRSTPDLETVVAFQFALGASIPADEWERYSLPAIVANEPVD